MDKASFDAGRTTGQVEEKGNQAADKAGSLFQSAKETAQGAGAQIATSAAQATEAVKNATGLNKK